MKGGCVVGIIPGMAPTGTLGDGESPKQFRGAECVAWDKKSARGCSGPLSLVQFSSPSPSPQNPLWRALGLKMRGGSW